MIEPIPDEPIPESVLAKNPRALTYEQFYRMRNGHKTRSAQAQRRYIDSKLNALQAAYAFWELENVRHILRLLVRFDGACGQHRSSADRPGGGRRYPGHGSVHFAGFRARTSSIMGRRSSSRMPGRSSIRGSGIASTTASSAKPHSIRPMRICVSVW